MIIVLDIIVCLWIIFFGGSHYLVNFFDRFYPGINDSQVKFFAWILLVTLPVYYFLF